MSDPVDTVFVKEGVGVDTRKAVAAYAAWRVQRDAAMQRDAARRAGASIRPLQLLRVDPVQVITAEAIDPFWRATPPPKPVADPAPEPLPVVSVPVSEADLRALVAGLDPMPDHEGEFQVARRWWVSRRDLVPERFCQTVTVRRRPSPQPGVDVHTDLAGVVEETRAWALLALDAAGIESSWWQVAVRCTEWWLVPVEERDGIPSAPNARPEPDPVFAALDAVDDEQVFLQRAEVRRVLAAVAAWRAAVEQEGEPTASNTPYQQGFFLDLGLKLKVADGTAKILVHTADDLERKTPAVWEVFLRGRVPWRAMQRVHAAIDGLKAGVLGEFTGRLHG